MESKGGKKKSSSSSSSNSQFYEAPLGFIIEDVRPNGGIKKFRSAAYSNVSFFVDDVVVHASNSLHYWSLFQELRVNSNFFLFLRCAVRSQTILTFLKLISRTRHLTCCLVVIIVLVLIPCLPFLLQSAPFLFSLSFAVIILSCRHGIVSLCNRI